MYKIDELNDPNSCLNRAADDEMIFTLRGHDVASPSTIRAWAAKRIELGKNKPDDAQILEALECANIMEKEREAAQAPSHAPFCASKLGHACSCEEPSAEGKEQGNDVG